MMPFAVLLLCVLSLTQAAPLAPSPSPSGPGHTLLIPVTVLTSFGPQVVLIPVNTAEWSTQRNLKPAPQSQAPQHQVKSENVAESVNSPFLLPHTPPDPSPNTPLTPEGALPQGQMFPVWNSLPVVPLQPSVTGQTVFPSLAAPAGGVGQTQVVSVVRQAVLSNSASSEEGDTTQLIYLLPVSAEIPNMGITEGGEGGTDPNANANTNIDPNMGHLQHPTTTPIPTPTPAGLQESAAPQDQMPGVGAAENGSLQKGPAGGSAVSSGGTPAATVNPCPKKGRRAGIQAKGPSP